jgi:hypothetical protein
MSNLLVGCRVSINHGSASEEDAVIVHADRNSSGDRCVWVVFEDGTPGSYLYNDKLKIHADDAKFLMRMAKSYKDRERILTERTERFEILDL